MQKHYVNTKVFRTSPVTLIHMVIGLNKKKSGW